MNLYQKFVKVREGCESIPENGKNREQGYSYAMARDVTSCLRKQLCEQGIDFHANCEEAIKNEREVIREWKGQRKTSVLTSYVVKMRYTLINADNPEEKTSSIFYGYGQDYGDKALYKAYTGALKYFLMEFDLLSAGDDPEADPEIDKPFQKPQPKNTPKNTPTTELDTKIVSSIKKILGDCNPEEMQALFKMASAFVDTKTGEIKALSTMKGVSEKWKLTAYGKLKKLSDIPDVFLKAGEDFGVELKDLTPEQRDQLIFSNKKRLNNDYDLLMPEY